VGLHVLRGTSERLDWLVMSVRGEFRRLLDDLVATLRGGGHVRLAAELEPLRARAEGDLSGAAEEALAILPRAGGVERAADRAAHLAEVCRVIVGRA